MHIDPPADLQAWFDAHEAELLKSVPALRTFDGEDASRVELMKRFTNDAAFQSKYETDLMAAVAALGAPDQVRKELVSFRDALHQQWSKFTSHDRAAVANFVNGLSATTSKAEIVHRVADTLGAGSVSAQASASMVRGIAPLMANVPWWCIICYTIPIWGLVCIAVKRCRGGSVQATTNAAVA